MMRFTYQLTINEPIVIDEGDKIDGGNVDVKSVFQPSFVLYENEQAR